MKPSAFPAPDNPKKPRVLNGRRFILLATTIASLGTAAIIASPDLNFKGT